MNQCTGIWTHASRSSSRPSVISSFFVKWTHASSSTTTRKCKQIQHIKFSQVRTPSSEAEKLNFNISNNLTNTSSLLRQNATEILIYCQNFNRMKSPSKMKEIQQNLLSSSFKIILGTESSWDESVRSEGIWKQL